MGVKQKFCLLALWSFIIEVLRNVSGLIGGSDEGVNVAFCLDLLQEKSFVRFKNMIVKLS